MRRAHASSAHSDTRTSQIASTLNWKGNWQPQVERQRTRTKCRNISQFFRYICQCDILYGLFLPAYGRLYYIILYYIILYYIILYYMCMWSGCLARQEPTRRSALRGRQTTQSNKNKMMRGRFQQSKKPYRKKPSCFGDVGWSSNCCRNCRWEVTCRVLHFGGLWGDFNSF